MRKVVTLLATITGLLMLISGCARLDVDSMHASVFRIYVTEQDGRTVIETGTSFLLGRRPAEANGSRPLLVTNQHIVANVTGARRLFVAHLVAGQPRFSEMRVVRADADLDLALTETTEALDLSGRSLKLANYDPENGSEVVAFGFPGAGDVLTQNSVETLMPSTTTGTVSRTLSPSQAFRRRIVQHQAPISSGNSGGPLLDRCGNVVGINFGNHQTAPGLFLAVHASDLIRLAGLAGVDVTVANGGCGTLSALGSMRGLAVVAMSLFGLSMAAILMRFKRSPARSSNASSDGSSSAQNDAVRKVFGGSEQTNGAAAPTVLDHGARGTPVAFFDTISFVPLDGGPPLVADLFALDNGELSIGRSSKNDIVIADGTVSNRHARLIKGAGGDVCIEDLNSSNGTWKGAAKVDRTVLSDRDEIRLGNKNFRCEFARYGDAAKVPSGSPDPLTQKVAWVLSGFDQFGNVMQLSLRVSEESSKEWMIGRRRGDLVIPDPTISQEHALLRHSPSEGLQIKDLNSANGTFTDGEQVTTEFVSMENVSEIRLGDFKLTLSRG